LGGKIRDGIPLSRDNDKQVSGLVGHPTLSRDMASPEILQLTFSRCKEVQKHDATLFEQTLP
jgi:hypothetical protein